MNDNDIFRNLIIVRGAGDIASGTIHRLWRAGFPVTALEIANPSAIRRQVAFSEAVFDGSKTIEGVTCIFAENLAECRDILRAGGLPLLIDETGQTIQDLKPHILIDAILAKKNIGTTRQMADFVIGLGPGFSVGQDVDCVIETMRGHDLGRIIYAGSALPNTGVPGMIAGVSSERVIHAPANGNIKLIHDIGDIVEAGDIIATIGSAPVRATISGVLRGIIRNGFPVTKGLKIADIDPRTEQQKNCYTISDKSRAIAGSVLEAIMAFHSGR